MNLKSTIRELNNIRYALDQSAIVAIADHSGQIIHVNDKFCEISKYSREELLGQNHRIINSGYHAPEFFVELWNCISNGKTWEGEIKNRAKDGSYYWVNTSIIPFLDESGIPYQYISIRYNITQQKAAEEELRISAQRLEQSNRELREREVQVLMQDRLASAGLLASSLAHEVGTPLGVIRGRAEYLALQLRDNETIRKNVDIIVSQIDRVTTLIRSLLNLARGDNFGSKGEIVLNPVVSEVIDLMGLELRKNKIEIQNRIPSAIPVKVSAETASLQQVLLNLLLNSVHAIESAVKQQGRTRDHFIRLSTKDEGSQWALEVTDNGCGISQTNMRNLFKPFFTTKDIGVGTGLGLLTSYRIVASWGGTIQVESEERVGTTFRVLLPKSQVARGELPRGDLSRREVLRGELK